jgi:hypothetical protein
VSTLYSNLLFCYYYLLIGQIIFHFFNNSGAYTAKDKMHIKKLCNQTQIKTLIH